MKYTIGFVLLIAIAVGIWYVTPHDSAIPQVSVSPTASVSATPSVTPSATPTPTISVSATPTQSAGAFTVAQVATHNSGASCYTIIRNTVYDLTTWVRQHPGGPGAILGICGKDGTGAFEDQHGGKSQQENTLATFKIGVITN